MDIDSPNPTATVTTTTTIANMNTTTQVKIHPLAIIGISDHQTRIVTGGSPLSSHYQTTSKNKNTPQQPPAIIGLLFGYYHHGKSTATTTTTRTIHIVDAEEIQINYHKNSESIITTDQQKVITTKIELHRKVFPLHQVVGWYRVVVDNNDNKNDEQEDVVPTDHDLLITNSFMMKYNQEHLPLFLLMDATTRKSNNCTTDHSSVNKTSANNHRSGNDNLYNHVEEKHAKKTKNDNDHTILVSSPSRMMGTMITTTSLSSTITITSGIQAREKLDREEELPITIYQSVTTSTNTSTIINNHNPNDNEHVVFINLDFEVSTYEPERIAIEQVFKSQQPIMTQNTNHNENITTSNTTTTTTQSIQSSSSSSAAIIQIESLITSIESMNIRIAILIDFLKRTQSGEIEPHYTLLKNVKSLVNQLPLVLGKGLLNNNNTSNTIGKTKNGDEKEEMMMIVNDNLEEDDHEHDIYNELSIELDNEYDDMLTVSLLASIAKTTKAVLRYSEKMKIMNESNGGGKGAGRGANRERFDLMEG